MLASFPSNRQLYKSVEDLKPVRAQPLWKSHAHSYGDGCVNGARTGDGNVLDMDAIEAGSTVASAEQGTYSLPWEGESPARLEKVSALRPG
jgi:hypothetical protein